MSSYSVQNLTVNRHRQELLELQRNVLNYIEKCDLAIDEFRDIASELSKYGCASDNARINASVRKVKENINSFVSACNALTGAISEEQVEVSRNEMYQIVRLFSDTITDEICREVKKLNEVENKAVQRASKLDFQVGTAQPVLEQPMTFELDSALVDQANAIVHNKSVFSQDLRNNLKAELELAKMQKDESAFKAIESRISKTLSLACEYKEAVTEYKAQCRALKIKPEPVDCNKEGVKKLLELIKANAEMHKKETERQFIQEKFDEAMKSLGYTVYSAGKNGKVETTMYNVTDDIYIETARQTVTDGKEQVVVSFAKKEDASEELESSMVKWCSTNHNKLLDALANYGITAEVKTVLPPQKELVKNIGKAANKQEERTVKSESKKREERRPAAKNMMTMQADKK